VVFAVSAQFSTIELKLANFAAKADLRNLEYLAQTNTT